MVEVYKFELEPLRKEADFTYFRGRECTMEVPVLAVALTAERPSPQSARRLEHEYALASDLDSAWAARPLALTRYGG
jgi:hypothetical protein